MEKVTSQAMRNLFRITMGTIAVCAAAYMGYLGVEIYEQGFVETFLR